MDHVLILHYHEIWLKGGNKRYFQSRLMSAVKKTLADLPVKSLELVSDRLVLTPGDAAALPEMLERLGRVFGLASIAPARSVPAELDEISRTACALMEETSGGTFAVRAKIAAHEFGAKSMEVERAVGTAILQHLHERGRDIRVNLTAPEVTCRIEVVSGRAFVSTRRIPGAGGLPATTAGRLLVLLSGGFDSSVAAYKMMRRGAHLSFAHFYAAPGPSRGSSRPIVEDIVRTLTPNQFTSRLYLLPFESVQRQIVAGAPENLRVLLYRRMMARIAREIARVEHALGLVTGDSVSQVASQTLHNLAALDHGIDLPVYRPLAGDDKEEILALARRIGTYRISCEPFEDCCPRFMPRSPAIFSNPEELDRAEAALDVPALVRMGLEPATALEFKYEGGKLDVQEEIPRRFQKLLARREGPDGLRRAQVS